MYRKAISSDLLLNANAFHENTVKTAVITGQANRILQISDSPTEDLKDLENRLLINGYNKTTVKNRIKIAKNKFEQKRVKPEKKANKQKNGNSNNNASDNETVQINNDEQTKPFMVTKYLGNLTKKIRKRVKNLNIKLISKRQINLEGRFSRGFKYKTNLEKGIVYQLTCQCGQTYIGETAFDLQKRIKEHQRDIRLNVLSNANTIHHNLTGHFID